MQTLKQNLEEIITISDAEWQEVSKLFKSRYFKKHEMIYQGGEIMDVVFYLSNGVAKSYIYDAEHKEFIWQIYYNHAKLSTKSALLEDCVSYYDKTPSLLNFEALEDVECYEISRADLERLYESDMKWQYMGRMLTQSAYGNAYKRVVSIMTQNATARYTDLLNTYPNIFDYVKAYHIAAYLGIAPQSLSRLRKKLS